VYAEESSNRPLHSIPPFRASAGLIFRYDRFSAQVEGQYSAPQHRTSDFELPPDSYFLFRASIECTVPVGQAELNFYVRGTNLTNAKARLHTS
jgi:iron complex outermembrane receptor protein